MAIGLLGKKLGMTHVYDEHGRRIIVTAIQAGPCTVVAQRVRAEHGYDAIALGFESVEASKLIKPVAGQFKKAGVAAFRYVREFRLTADECVTHSPETPVQGGSAQAKPPGKKQDKPKPAGSHETSGEVGEKAPEQVTASEAQGGWSVGQQLTVDVFQDYELVDVIGTSVGRGFQGGIKRWNWSGGAGLARIDVPSRAWFHRCQRVSGPGGAGAPPPRAHG